MKRAHRKDSIINFESVNGSLNTNDLKLGIYFFNIPAESNKRLIHTECCTRLYFYDDPCRNFKNI